MITDENLLYSALAVGRQVFRTLSTVDYKRTRHNIRVSKNPNDMTDLGSNFVSSLGAEINEQQGRRSACYTSNRRSACNSDDDSSDGISTALVIGIVLLVVVCFCSCFGGLW